MSFSVAQRICRTLPDVASSVALSFAPTALASSLRSMFALLSMAFVTLSLTAVVMMSQGVQAEERTTAFAGGCFWCVESDFEKLEGVIDVVSGFTGGSLPNPTYRGNHQGHYEAAEITYDSDKISYSQLLRHFWRTVDPLDDGGQFCDRGFSYKTAIFTANDEERQMAEQTLAEVDALFPDDNVATVILPSGRFWPVEEYHQDYARKNPLRYRYYRLSCGRDSRVNELWEDKTWGLD